MITPQPPAADPGRLLTRRCPVCGDAPGIECLRKQSLRLVRCQRCSMVFADPIEAGWADGTYYDQLSGPFYLSEAKLRSDHALPRFARELALFRRYCLRGLVVDVGCSTGGFLSQLRSRYPGDYDTVGIDVAGPALDHAASLGIRVVRESFPVSSLADASADAVTFWAVMEHLEDPGVFLSKMARVLRPGGHGFVLVPNFASLAVRLLGFKYRYLFPQHVNYFTRATLRRFVALEPSLVPVHEGSMHFNPLVLVQDFRGGGAFVPDAERAALLQRTTAYKQRKALAPLKVVLGGVEVLLGRMGLADNIVVVLRKTAGKPGHDLPS